MPAPNSSIDHSATSDIVCPWCGYEDRDSWEVDDSDEDMECGRCEKHFSMERDVSVTYSTYRFAEECQHENGYKIGSPPIYFVCDSCGLSKNLEEEKK